MSSLDISEQRAEDFLRIEGKALKIIEEYFDGERQGGDDVVAARCLLATVKGNRQTATMRETLKYSMVRDLDDPKAMRKYVKATQPEIKKILTDGKK